MRTMLLVGALTILGFFPVVLVLSVWDDDPEPEAQAPLSEAEQARRNAEARRFALNRDGCEMAIRQVERRIAKLEGPSKLALDRCDVQDGSQPLEMVARGRAKFLGARQWDPPVGFAVWFVNSPRGAPAPCSILLEGRSRKRVAKPHRDCADWSGRG